MMADDEVMWGLRVVSAPGLCRMQDVTVCNVGYDVCLPVSVYPSVRLFVQCGTQ